ncbi:hypothetical protein THOG05_230088 [Vibrio rotiferianus]|nr:hypothetical protein THOG05_230088 [Vibrio rotiferianus]
MAASHQEEPSQLVFFPYTATHFHRNAQKKRYNPLLAILPLTIHTTERRHLRSKLETCSITTKIKMVRILLLIYTLNNHSFCGFYFEKQHKKSPLFSELIQDLFVIYNIC